MRIVVLKSVSKAVVTVTQPPLKLRCRGWEIEGQIAIKVEITVIK